MEDNIYGKQYDGPQSDVCQVDIHNDHDKQTISVSGCLYVALLTIMITILQHNYPILNQTRI